MSEIQWERGGSSIVLDVCVCAQPRADTTLLLLKLSDGLQPFPSLPFLTPHLLGDLQSEGHGKGVYQKPVLHHPAAGLHRHAHRPPRQQL